MKVLYNTTDNLYLGADMKHAFTHAYNLGKSDWSGDIDKAYNEFASEYTANSMADLTKEAVVKAVAEHMGTSTFAILSQEYGRSEKISKSRLLVCWFTYMYTRDTVFDIAEYMGYKNHASVIFGANKINTFLESDAAYRTTVGLIKGRLLYMGYKLQMKVRMNKEVELITVD